MKRKTIKHNQTRNKQKEKNKNRRSKKEKEKGLSDHIGQPTRGRLEVSLSLFVANRISPCFHPSHTHTFSRKIENLE
jgi:hypothetical protein